MEDGQRHWLGGQILSLSMMSSSNLGCFQLTCSDTNKEVARYTYALSEEGLFAGEKKTVLRIQPLCTVDIDLVVISFVIMEKNRRDRDGDGSKLTPHDEDPQGEGCADAGEA